MEPTDLLASAELFYKLAKSAGNTDKVKIKKFKNGIVINGEFGSEEVAKILKPYLNKLPLIIADVPYGKIVKNDWDQNVGADDYLRWTADIAKYLESGGSTYVWGAYGTYQNRPFFQYLGRLENEQPDLRIQNFITWCKRRAYGTQFNYLHTTEHAAWITKGERPSKFKVPYLDEERGYDGWSDKYKAHSKFLRRKNYWLDAPEILGKKYHIAQKPEKLAEIMIETHTKKGDWVMDPFAGSGSTGMAAKRLGRKFILIERDPFNFKIIVDRLEKTLPDKKASLNYGGDEWLWGI